MARTIRERVPGATGRPKSSLSKHTIKRAVTSKSARIGSDDESDVHVLYGRHLSLHEGLFLAKCCVLESHKDPILTSKSIREGITEALFKRYGITRSPGSFRLKWRALQVETQIYLGVLGSAHNTKKGRKSVMTSEDQDDPDMRLYCSRTCRRNNNVHLASSAPFTYIAAIQGAQVRGISRRLGEDCNTLHYFDGHDEAYRGEEKRDGDIFCILLDDLESFVASGDAPTDDSDLFLARRPKGEKSNMRKEKEERDGDGWIAVLRGIKYDM